MENRFAGAQSQGERRRRRLANSEDNSFTAVEQVARQFSSGENGRSQSGSPKALVQLGILRRFVSPYLWKHSLFLALLMIGLGGLLWEHSRETPTRLGIHRNADLPSSVAGLLLLLAGQLAVITGWIRSQSGIDFRGRYRWWKWLAGATIALGIGLITNTVSTVPDALALILEPLIGTITAARPTLVAVPVMAFCAVVFSRVLPDMSRCIWSQSLLVIAVLTAIVQQMLVNGSAHHSIRSETLNAMMVLTAYLTFASMLIHCRYVAFVNNDPPSVQPTNAPAIERIADEGVVDVRSPASRQSRKTQANGSGGESDSDPSKTSKKSATSSRRRSKANRRKTA